MSLDELHCLYRTLRQELDAAYAAKDAQRIDRIAEDLLPIERQLARLQQRESAPTDPPSHPQ
jgi:hypothetical protein